MSQEPIGVRGLLKQHKLFTHEYSIYWSEYRAVKGNSELSELPDYLEERSTFDAKA